MKNLIHKANDNKEYPRDIFEMSFDYVLNGDSILSLIGNTPTVELKKINRGPTRIFAKLEGANPSGSLKDRAALFMIRNAIDRRKLRPGMRAFDASSGNMASAITLIAKRFGYESSFVLGNTLTKEKRQFMELMGAELIRFDGNTWECSKNAQRIAKDNPEKYCFMDQFRNPANLAAHYRTTGPEIYRDIPEADAYVASLGSGGSLCGAGMFLKEEAPGIKIIGVSAETGTRIPGLRNLEEEGFFPPLADEALIDDIIRVSDFDAKKTVRRLLKEEGILFAKQGAAVIWATLQLAATKRFQKIVALIGDTSLKNMDSLLEDLSE